MCYVRRNKRNALQAKYSKKSTKSLDYFIIHILKILIYKIFKYMLLKNAVFLINLAINKFEISAKNTIRNILSNQLY